MFPKSRIIWKKDDGFSLVELMIVVAIIGILAGLAVPKFNLFQAKARQAEVLFR
jgi:type IV pilus assembly protein PilA